MQRRSLLACWALAVAPWGCSGNSSGSEDSGKSDAGLVDAALLTPDAGPADSGSADAGATDAASSDAGGVDAGVDAGPRAPEIFYFTLDAGAFPPTPNHPSAIVYSPASFNPAPPVNFVVFLHGFNNSIENIIQDAGQSCVPDAGSPVRQAYGLITQFESAGKNALLLCPEIDFDQATGNPGALGVDGGFREMLGEIIWGLQSSLGPFTLNDVGQVIVISHSGGYQAAAGIAQRGGVPVNEVDLLDSLYGNFADFDAWCLSNLSLIETTPPLARFADVYTSTGGTLANSQAMAGRAATWVSADAGALVDDRTTSTWPLATYQHGLLFKMSALAHDDVPRYYFEKLVATSNLPAR